MKHQEWLRCNDGLPSLTTPVRLFRFPDRIPITGRFLMAHPAGYFDESDDNERAFAIGGFIGHQNDCVHLEWAWDKYILKKYELEYFKASELNAGAGQFAKFRDDPSNLHSLFSPREKDLWAEIKTKTVDVFLDSEVMGYGAVLMLPDYYRLLDELKQVGQALPSPYFLCAQMVYMESGLIMNELNDGVTRNEQGYIRPTFDSHEMYSGRAKQVFDGFCEKNPISARWLLRPHYESEKDYTVIQVADNLAYEMRRLLITTEYDTHIPERKAMKRMREKLWKVYKLGYDEIRKIMASPKNIIPIEPEIHNPEQKVKRHE